MESARETAEKPDTNPFTEPVYRAAVRSRFAEQGIDQIIWIRNEQARCDFEVTPRITQVKTGSRLTNSAASTDTRIGTLSISTIEEIAMTTIKADRRRRTASVEKKEGQS